MLKFLYKVIKYILRMEEIIKINAGSYFGDFIKNIFILIVKIRKILAK